MIKKLYYGIPAYESVDDGGGINQHYRIDLNEFNEPRKTLISAQEFLAGTVGKPCEMVFDILPVKDNKEITRLQCQK